jgi:hypothetical protein
VRKLSIGWSNFPQLIVASIECILEDNGVVFDRALTDIEYLSAKGVKDVLFRVRRGIFHPESWAGTVGELLLNDARSDFGDEGISGEAQPEAHLSEAAVGL